MDIENLQKICAALPGVTEDIKWGQDLVFSVALKMFFVVGLEQVPASASFKVPDEDFDTMCERKGFKPAPYMAKHKWVWVDDISRMKKTEWKKYLEQSYSLVRSKLPKKVQNELK